MVIESADFTVKYMNWSENSIHKNPNAKYNIVIFMAILFFIVIADY